MNEYGNGEKLDFEGTKTDAIFVRPREAQVSYIYRDAASPFRPHCDQYEQQTKLE